MQARFVVVLALLAALEGCAYDVETGESENEFAVEGLSAPLGSCEGRTEELRDFAFWARNETIEALTRYNQDPNNELAVTYFGPNHDQQRVRSTLLRTAMIGGASHSLLHFECLPETDPSCDSPDEPALWVKDGDYRNSSWTIRVCGDRFWDSDYVSGVDSGLGASQVGVMVHELSHLGGAYRDEYRGEDSIKDLAVATDVFREGVAELTADAYRFYVMKTVF